MKQSPEAVRLDMTLRSSALVAGGFMGDDPRSVSEVMDADAGALSRLGVTAGEVAARMREITDKAATAESTWVEIDANREAVVNDTRGSLPCPWPHEAWFLKRVTTLRRKDTGKTVRWSELNIHMIAAHGFFEGKGSLFRTEPADLVEILF